MNRSTTGASSLIILRQSLSASTAINAVLGRGGSRDTIVSATARAPAGFALELAKTLNNQAIMLAGQNRAAEAREGYEKARDIEDELSSGLKPTRQENRLECAGDLGWRGQILLTHCSESCNSSRRVARLIFPNQRRDYMVTVFMVLERERRPFGRDIDIAYSIFVFEHDHRSCALVDGTSG